MLLIRRSVLFISFAIMSMPVLFFGIYGYAALEQFDELKNHKLKFIAETHVFITIIVFIFLIFMFVMLYLRSRNVYKKLDRAREILSYVSVGEGSLGNYFGRMGLLGSKINDIYLELIKLNVIKAKKISSMAAIIKVLLENSSWSVVLFDNSGKALRCSKQLLMKYGLEISNVIETPFDSLFLGVDFQEIRAELKRTRDLVIKESVKSGGVLKYEGDLICCPIFDVSGEFSNALCLLAEKNLVGTLSLKTEQM